MIEEERYKDFDIFHEPLAFLPKSHPGRQDWVWVHKDYDGAPDAFDDRHGRGTSIEDCKKAIDEFYENA